nr:hypothetical protein [uncultured Oscillibacter sp.]
MDIVCVKSTQNRCFASFRLFDLPERRLLVNAVESSYFITRKKSAGLIQRLVSPTSQEQIKQINRPYRKYCEAGQRDGLLCSRRDPHRHSGKAADQVPVHRVHRRERKSPQA